jgi:hypothetical protein
MLELLVANGWASTVPDNVSKTHTAPFREHANKLHKCSI